MSCIKDLVDIAAVLKLPLNTIILPEGLLYILRKDIDVKAFKNFISKDVWDNTVLKSIAERLELSLQSSSFIYQDLYESITTLKYSDGKTLYCTMRETESAVYYGIWVDTKNYGFPTTLRDDIIPKAGFKAIDVHNDVAQICSLKTAGYPTELFNKRLINGITSGYLLRT